MTKTLKTPLILTLAIAGFGGAGRADTVKSDYNHQLDFAQFRTYSWGPVKTADPLWVDRIRQDIDQALQSKGWQLVPIGGDTTIFATSQVHNQQELQTNYDSFGPGWGGGWGWRGFGWGAGGGFGEATTTTVNQPVADLVIDIFHGGTKELIWRGMVERDVSNKSEKNIKDIEKDIDKLFKDFPPKSKK